MGIMQYNIPASLLVTVLIFLGILYFIWIKRFAVAALVILYYSFFLLIPLIPMAKLSYLLKWGIYIGIILIWSIKVIGQRLQNGSIKYKITILASLLFITSALFSGFWSTGMSESIFRALTFILLFLLAYIIVPADSVENRVRDFLASIYLFDGVISLICICGLPLSSFWLAGRFGGLSQNANTMAIFAYTLLILSLVALSLPKSYRPLHLLVAILSFVVVIITKSRGGYLAAMGGVLTFFFFNNKKLFRYSIIMLLLIPLLIAPLEMDWQKIFESLIRGGSISEIGAGRWEIAQQAWKIFLEHPFFGVGMGGWGLGSETDPKVWIGNMQLAAQAGYLAILCETGLLGFGLYFTWLFGTFLAGRARYKLAVNHPEEISPTLWAGLMGLFMAYALHGLVEGFPTGAGNYVAIRTWYMAGVFVYYFREKQMVTSSTPHIGQFAYRRSQDYLEA